MEHLVCVDKLNCKGITNENIVKNHFHFCSWKLQFLIFYPKFVERNGMLYYGLLFTIDVRIIKH